jgi:hypothetical protein
LGLGSWVLGLGSWVLGLESWVLGLGSWPLVCTSRYVYGIDKCLQLALAKDDNVSTSYYLLALVFTRVYHANGTYMHVFTRVLCNA